MPWRKLSAAPPGVQKAPVPTAGKQPARRGAADSIAAAAATAGAMQRLVAAVREAGGESDAVPALAALRTPLSVQTRPPIKEAIDAGAAEALARHLASPCAPVQAEAAWALTNLCSGSSAETRAASGLAREACQALLTQNALQRAELCNQLLWALGNMASDEDTSIRDRLLGLGIVATLGDLFAQIPSLPWGQQERVQVLRSMTWLSSGLCRGDPAPPLEEVECFLDYFVQVIHGTEDAQMTSDALWGICFLVEAAPESGASRLLSAGFADGALLPTPHPTLDRVVQCTGRAGDARSPIAVPALRLLGALLAVPGTVGDHVAAAALLAGALGALVKAVEDAHAPAEIRRDAAWAMANLARGTPQQAQKLTEDATTWRVLCSASWEDPSPEVRYWSMMAAAEAFGRVGEEAMAQVDVCQATKLLEVWGRAAQAAAVAGVLAPMQEAHGASTAASKQAELQAALLGAAEALLRHPGRGGGGFEGLFESRVVRGFVEDLQQSSDEAVRQKAIHLVGLWHAVANEASSSPKRNGENGGANYENMSWSPNRPRAASKPLSAAHAPGGVGCGIGGG